MQSSLSPKPDRRLHVGVIMDGNGRWATSRGLPRHFGHRAGADAVRRLVEVAPTRGIGVLTLFAFSTENWRRPEAEISALMGLLLRYLETEVGRLARAGARLRVIGRRDRLSREILDAVDRAERATANGDRLLLRIAVDYSAREAIVAAAARSKEQADLSWDAFARLLCDEPEAREVDLIIRTSGEQRLSDFLLWESAFAELHFAERLWPDFSTDDLDAALIDYFGRERRFGAVLEEPIEA